MEIKPVGLYDATQEVETLYAALLDTQAELSRLRAENERLRAVVEAAFTHDHIVLIGEDGPCNICVALAALDQERKEGE